MSYKSVSSLAVAMLLALSLANPALADHVGHSNVDHSALGAHPDNSRRYKSIQNVPEPSSILLFAAGLIGLIGIGRRSQKQNTPNKS